MFTIEFIRTTCVAYFAGVPEVEALYLFGSFADGTATASSDIDLGVLYRRDLQPEVMNSLFLRDWPLVSQALRTDDVDFVCLNTTHSIELKFAIVQDGVCLIDRSDRLAEYEANIKTEYHDHIAALRRAGYLV